MSVGRDRDSELLTGIRVSITDYFITLELKIITPYDSVI